MASVTRYGSEALGQAYEDELLRSRLPSRRVVGVCAVLLMIVVAGNAVAVATLPSDSWAWLLWVSGMIALVPSVVLLAEAWHYLLVRRIRGMLRAPLPATAMYMRRLNQDIGAPTMPPTRGEVPWAVLSRAPDTPPLVCVQLMQEHLCPLGLPYFSGLVPGERVQALGAIAPGQWILIHTDQGMLWPVARAKRPSRLFSRSRA
jgi:hypothetical protein